MRKEFVPRVLPPERLDRSAAPAGFPSAGDPSSIADATASDVSVRLDIGRTGIGVELAAPVRLGCVTVVELIASLSGIRFPIDVTGGVARFRHRRGVLQRVGLDVRARDVERWTEARLAGMWGAPSPRVWLGVRNQGASVSLAVGGDQHDEGQSEPVLAFEIDVLADSEDLVFVVHDARGICLPRSAIGAALECMQALLSGIAARSGATFRVVRGAASLARHILPRAGARAPATRDVPWTSIAASGDAWTLVAMARGSPQVPSSEALRAREVAALLTDADDALFEGDDIAARDLCLSALERAPRHPSIVARIVDIDARAGGRAEAALSLMNESRGALSRGGGRFAAPLELPLGTLNGVDLMLGTLLAETGDIDGAVASLARFVAHERSPALSARVAALAASLCSDPFDAARHLDEALAREPRSRGARWLRVAKRLEMERPGDALADVEHLDALAHGKTAKHAVWMRAGGLWRRAGHGGQAGELFERALRYVPDDAVALAGLGVALVEESRPGDGRDRRGITVLSRALAVAERAHTPSEAIRLDLARFLAERIHDFPAAIAHVSQIAPAANEAGIARGLEGRWRAQLGDVAGASIAFERLREHTESQAPLVRDHERARALMELLVEGAELFEKGLHDLPGALRCLEVAHGILPEDPDLRARYRQLREQTLPCGAPAHSAVPEAMAEFDVANASARVEELTQRLRADPSEDVTADELAFLLERLGRSHELVALLFARMEDASGERRARLLPRVRETLERVAEDAEVGGRLEEASLFRVALAGL